MLRSATEKAAKSSLASSLPGDITAESESFSSLSPLLSLSLSPSLSLLLDMLERVEMGSFSEDESVSLSTTNTGD